jgi:hypothetical protein
LDGGADIDDLVNIPVREAIGRVKYLDGDTLKVQVELINKRLANEIGDLKAGRKADSTVLMNSAKESGGGERDA